MLIVSIHDVAPSTMPEVRYLLGALDAMGAAPRVLKVVPNEEGTHDIRDDPALVRLLAGEVAAGSEVVLHGYTHRAAGPLRGSWDARLRARLFAGAAAEFLTLDGAHMRERLVAGRQSLLGTGVAPRGFCAPCWLASPELPRLLRECGFRYSVHMMSVLDVARGRRLWTPWLGYMGAGAAQERLVSLGGEVLMAAAARCPVVKVFLHPQDAVDSPACARILQALARLVHERRLVTYDALLNR